MVQIERVHFLLRRLRSSPAQHVARHLRCLVRCLDLVLVILSAVRQTLQRLPHTDHRPDVLRCLHRQLLPGLLDVPDRPVILPPQSSLRRRLEGCLHSRVVAPSRLPLPVAIPPVPGPPAAHLWQSVRLRLRPPDNLRFRQAQHRLPMPQRWQPGQCLLDLECQPCRLVLHPASSTTCGPTIHPEWSS